MKCANCGRRVRSVWGERGPVYCSDACEMGLPPETDDMDESDDVVTLGPNDPGDEQAEATK